MRNDIQVKFQLPDKWASTRLSISEAIDYCDIAMSAYSLSHKFDDEQKSHQYSTCKSMLCLINPCKVISFAINAESQKYVLFKIIFDTCDDCELFYTKFKALLKDSGYKTPDEPD